MTVFGEICRKKKFRFVKRLMATTPRLVPFGVNAQTRLSTDASSFGLGVILMQTIEAGWRPLAYASLTMTMTERKNFQVEKEALAICWAVEKFHICLAGRMYPVL